MLPIQYLQEKLKEADHRQEGETLLNEAVPSGVHFQRF